MPDWLPVLLAVLGVSLLGPGPARCAPAGKVAPPALPSYLPRYSVEIDLDTAGHSARVRQQATWTNPSNVATDRLVLNAHGRYVVPKGEIGFMAKMLEILRVQPGEALGFPDPAVEVLSVRLCERPGTPAAGEALKVIYEGDTQTAMVVFLPRKVGPGESVTVTMDIAVKLPQKQGRWGQWEGVTTLSNWLPVFAYFGPVNEDPLLALCRSAADSGGHGKHQGPAPVAREVRRGKAPAEPGPATWQPVPFIPWHQPFFNEAGIYDVRLTLPCDQQVATTGSVVRETVLGDGRKTLHIRAEAVREYTFVASARFRIYEGEAKGAGTDGKSVRVRVLAFPEHEFFARHMVRISSEALVQYAQWWGPYPWADFTIAECFFGWNGNECSTLVMIDERVFAMPHIGVGYVEYLVSHETGHQWWYNLIGTQGYCETWMDEAVVNYNTHRHLNKKLGRNNALIEYPSGLEWLPTIRRDDYRSSGMYGTFGRGENAPVIQEMPKFGHLVNLFNLCYDKGGRIVGMIEERLGSQEYDRFMRRVATKYRYRVLRVADFRRELEEYTGHPWEEFFANWLYGKGLCDWAVEKVVVTLPPGSCQVKRPLAKSLARVLSARGARPDEAAAMAGVPRELPPGGARVEVWVHQKAEYDEPTTLGFALCGSEAYSIRVPILPGAKEPYRLDEISATVTPLGKAGHKGGALMKVEIDLPAEPEQIAVDPDQVMVDANPANNFWRPPVSWRFTPLYTFLEETDLTRAWDRWNLVAGPWLNWSSYPDPWFTRSTMVGARVGAYRTQEFVGGAYAAYRTDFRDVVVGVDALWHHWPFDRSQAGLIVEQRVAQTNNGDLDATRAAAWVRHILTYGSSLYQPPMQYVDFFAHYSDNFLPYPTENPPNGVRYDRTTTLGAHYRINYLTPYWHPEGGLLFDAWYEGGIAQFPSTVGLHRFSGQFSYVQSAPNLTKGLAAGSALKRVGDWFADTTFAFRIYGAQAFPSRGEFFSMGGSDLFRGFDLAQRQGSGVWVGSVEWRVPIAQSLHVDCIDHVLGLRNAYAAVFYDVGDAYISGKQVGPVAHGVGAGLRLDMAIFSFVERATVRLDVAKAVNSATGMQVWLGVGLPF